MAHIKPIVLQGSAYERGFDYGRLLRPAIAEAIQRFKFQIAHVSHLDPDTLIGKLLATTRFVHAAESWTAPLLEELRGVADSTGIAWHDLFALQLQDEIQWWFRSSAPVGGDACSALGLDPTASQPSLVAQNLDQLGIYDGLECLLHIRYPDSPLECFVLSFAGLLALTGMNSAGVAVVCNALHKYLNNRVDGLPVTFLLRAILEQPSLAGALTLIESIPHASGQSYIAGDPGGTVCVECSANQVARYAPHAGRSFHTNHPLVSSDLSQPAVPGPEAGTTFDRFDYLAARLGDPRTCVDLDTVKFILSSHQGKAPICVHHGYQPDRNYTLGSVVCVLAAAPEFHVSLGPPCVGGYEVFRF